MFVPVAYAKQLTMHAFRILSPIGLLLMSRTISAFQSAPSTRLYISHHRLCHQHQHHTILYQSTQEDIEQKQTEQGEEDEYELVEFFVSPGQITTLRKEAKKRESKKKLPNFFLSPEESMEVSSETIESISKLFDNNELIEVRGISRDKKKYVFDKAYGLAETLEDVIEKPVVVVEIKGFAVKLYCPFDNDEDGKQRIQLRTSYKPGQWRRKPKPLRDNRGQIIMDEDGKSVKEIPE